MKSQAFIIPISIMQLLWIRVLNYYTTPYIVYLLRELLFFSIVMKWYIRHSNDDCKNQEQINFFFKWIPIDWKLILKCIIISKRRYYLCSLSQISLLFSWNESLIIWWSGNVVRCEFYSTIFAEANIIWWI